MQPIVSFLISQTILVPLVIGVIRFYKIDNNYHPFMLFLLMAFTAEVISFICRMVLHADTDIAINFYVLIECIILFFQFHTWNFLKKKKTLFYILIMAFIALWIAENVIFDNIDTFNPFFRVSYSFIIVLLSINQINYMIAKDSRHLLKSAKFLICIGFIIYFIYGIIYLAAYFVRQHNSDVATKIMNMFSYMNAFVNLLYGVATFLIPEKKKDLYFNRHFE